MLTDQPPPSSERRPGFKRIESSIAIFQMMHYASTPKRRKVSSGKGELLAQAGRVVGETFAMAVGIRLLP
jgi:hypothetical protein